MSDFLVDFSLGGFAGLALSLFLAIVVLLVSTALRDRAPTPAVCPCGPTCPCADPCPCGECRSVLVEPTDVPINAPIEPPAEIRVPLPENQAEAEPQSPKCPPKKCR